MTTKERYQKVFDYFKQNQPVAETELLYQTPYELMVAVILSAQCTDKRVNIISPSFFTAFPNIKNLAEAKPEHVFEIIRSCSYPNNKTKHLINAAQYIIDHYEGILPSEPEALMKIPGIGRKSANVIASIIYNQPVIAVDTHVFRVSARIGLTKDAKNPLEAEKQLTDNIPTSLLAQAHHWLILHGRYICTARKPKCNNCNIKPFCNYYNDLR